MKPNLKFYPVFWLLSLLIAVNSDLYSQRAAAELITSLPTPVFKENVSVKNGERFVLFYNNYLFAVNYWVGIQVWDVSQIEKPRKVSFLPTNDMVYHIAIHENRLYAANKTEGIIIFDISNLERPYEITRIKTPGDAYWVDVHYPYLYIAMGGDGFCIMDISNLNDPRTLTLEIPETWIWSLQYKDEKLFVAAKQGGLVIYDAANPTSLLKITQYKTGNHCLQFQIEDNLAYIADGPGGLLILDISAPRLPKPVGRFTTAGFTQHVFKSGNYAYLSNLELGLLIVKVNQPQNPQLEVRYITESQAYSSFKHDVYVFLASDVKTEILRHNNQPILESIADQTIDENFNFTLPLNAFDPDGDPIYFEAKNLPPGAAFDGKNGVFTWTPTYEQSGIYSGTIFSVIEKTGSRLSDSDTVTFTVRHVNRPPELPDIANRQIPEDSTLVIQVPEGSDPDKEDIGKLTYRVENAPEGAHFDPIKRIFSWKPTFDQSGVYIVDFVLDDGAGGIDRDAVTITVLHVDRPPKIDVIADAVVDEANVLTVRLSGQELDKEDLDKISFSMFNLPPGAVFDPASRTFSWTPTYEQSGSYNRVSAVMKAGKLSDTTFFNITVNHINRPPVLAALANQQIDENKKLHLVISGSDPDKEDAGKLVFSATNLPPGSSFTPDSLIFSWTPTFEQSGVYSDVQFSVKDPQGLTDQKSITITVNHVNRPPQLAEIPPLQGDENQLLQHQLVGSDPDAEDQGKLTYSATGLPPGATLDAVSGLFAWTPTYDQSGEYAITFTVSDGVLKDSKKTAVTINHINRPPVMADIPPQTVKENSALTFAVSGSDPDKEDQGKLVYTAENLPAGAVFSAATRTLSWTPTYDQAGIYENISFTVSDPAGLSSTKTAQITVINVNRPPVLTPMAAISGKEQETISFILQGSDPDKEDEGKLRYKINNLPVGATLDVVSGAFNWMPSFEQSGSYTLNAEVADSSGSLAQTKISISVANVNRPPVVEPLPTVSGKENEPLSIALKYSDPDKEDQGKLQVKVNNLPAGAKVNPATGIISWTPTYDQSGEYTIDYLITDSFGESTPGTVLIQIENVNRAPSLPTVDMLTGKENEPLSTILPEGTDPDKEDQGKLAYSVSNLPPGATFDGGSRSLQWTPSFEQAGSYSAIYTVTDLGGLTAHGSLNITIANVNRPPILPTMGNLQVEEGQTLREVFPEGNDPDQDDAGKLVYELSNMPAGANFSSSTRTLEWTPGFNQAGEYSLVYRVKDAGGEVATTPVSITVKDVNRSPEIKEVGMKTVKEGEEISFKVEVSDPDEQDQGKVSLSAQGVPSGANFNGSTGVFSWIPREDQQGEYQITFSARDSQGSSAQITVKIIVEDVTVPQ